MTSIQSGYSQIPSNKLYINLISLASTIVDSNNNPVAWAQAGAGNAALGLLSTPGSAVLRDLGKNVYLPDPTLATSVGSQSTILRRVQLVTNGTVGGYFGTGDSAASVAGSDTDYYCGYVRLGGQTYAGGNGTPSGVARLN
jgi:hypothetical protein